jgi:hypothetical protein
MVEVHVCDRQILMAFSVDLEGMRWMEKVVYMVGEKCIQYFGWKT